MESRFHYEESTGRAVIETVQDVQPILDANKRRAAEVVQGAKRGDGMRKVASIPNIVVHKWMQEGFNVYTATQEQLFRKLRDPDYRYLLCDNVTAISRLPSSIRGSLRGVSTESGFVV